MPNPATKAASLILIAGLGLTVSACTVSRLRISNDFGRAVRQDVMAQVADPTPTYTGMPAPGAIGARVDLAQQRYATGKVIPPASNTTSSVSLSTGQ